MKTNRLKAKSRRILAALLILSALVTSSCWDRREIEELGIVIGMSVDHARQKQQTSEEEKQFVHRHKKLLPISITYQIVNPKIIGGSTRGNPTNQKPYINITSSGDTAFQIVRETSTRIGRPPFFMHLKIIILGEEVSRKVDLTQLLNFNLRDTEMRRTVYLTIADGKGKEVLETSPKNEDLPSFELLSLINNLAKTIHIAQPISIGTVSEHLSADTSFCVPRVVIHQKEMKLAGAAIVSGKTGKMLGWIGEEETAGINLIQGTGKSEEGHKGGIIEAVIKGSSEPFSFEIGKIHSKIIPSVKNGQLSFKVSIKMEGRLGEDWYLNEDAFKEDYLQKVNAAVKKRIEEIVTNTLKKTQKEYRVDVAGFGKQLHIHNPKEWKKRKENWDEEFSRIPVSLDVTVKTEEFALKGKKR
ncbi:Ger(x)C family spore germination protein [Brevibacillus borstelensis]|uniref:Ger(x)C family spore germination protein n=1 Tax=Brevibacillus borstelensis TaxID=45462 RepID=UPI0030BAB030